MRTKIRALRDLVAVSVTRRHTARDKETSILKEMLDYYDRLEVAELEGDILKALEHGDSEKVARKYTSLVKARARLAAKELARARQD